MKRDVKGTRQYLGDQSDTPGQNTESGASGTRGKRTRKSAVGERNLLRNLIDNVPDHIYVKDTESRFVVANVALARHMGGKRPELLVGKTDFDFYPEELASQYYADERKVIESGQPVINREEAGMDRAGNRMWFSVTKVPLRDSSGNVAALAGSSRNITEQKRAEQELRNLITGARCLLWYALVEEKDGRLSWDIKISSEEAAQQFLPVNVLPGQSYTDAWNRSKLPEDRKRIDRNGSEALRSGTSGYSQEFRCRQPNGEVRWLREDVRIEPLGPGRWSLVGVCTDVTDRKRAEEALRDSEALYHSLVETLPVNVFRKDLEGKFTFGNRLFCGGLGRPLEEILGKTDFDFFPRELAEKYRGDDRRVAETGEVFQDIEEHQKPDGETIYVQVFKTPVRNHRGGLVGTQGIFWDVTDRRRAEEALAQEKYLVDSLMDNLPDSIYFKDMGSRFTKINRALARRFGLRDPQDALGKTDFDFFTDEHAHPAFEDEQEVIRSGRPLVAKEEKETWSDGRTRWVSTTKMPLRDKKGKIIGTFGVSRDITDRKRAEEKLRKTARDLAHSNAELEQFAYVASHDLQEPLRMVASFAQLLEKRYKGKLDSDADDFIAYIVDGATRMRVLINDLLAYSRVDTRGKPFQPTDCETVFERAFANLQVAMQESGAIVTHDPLPSVTADETQLTQLFQNLIGNAIKFCGQAPPRVHVSAEENGGEWLFSVRDNGLGIDPEYADRIFVIFQRLHGSNDYPGTGMGLAICKKIVERHGGRIWVESQPARGSTFYFTIPKRGDRQP